jgi:hypothetical protein
LLRLRNTMEEWLIDSGGVAETEPTTPCPVLALECCFADGVIDDSMVRSTSTTKDKISSGSWEMAKGLGISCGMRVWKRSVSSALHGESCASKLIFPSQVWDVKDS